MGRKRSEVGPKMQIYIYIYIYMSLYIRASKGVKKKKKTEIIGRRNDKQEKKKKEDRKRTMKPRIGCGTRRSEVEKRK